MFISKLKIEGYKNTYKPSEIRLNKGLNILVGENGCGKTAIINALRLSLRELESYSDFSEDDFYCSLDKKNRATEIKIDINLAELSEDEKITFLTWCDAAFDAHLHLNITENISRPGFFKRKYWGGLSSSSIFEEDTFDRVECIYLPPLRDAVSKLSSGRRSRLALLLKKQYGDNANLLVDSVKSFNDSIVENKDGKYSEIDIVRKSINTKIKESLGSELGQSINLQFSETTFNKIIENIKVVFFPHVDETDIIKFRDLATNSLGYNNLLYIATVFAELELIKSTDVFTVLLIEEPEAHLHPQLQVKFVKYLEELMCSLKNAQIIVSTHSPVLASSVSVEKIVHISDQDNKIAAIALMEKKYGDALAEKFINRWLDVTKSTMLFSRGIILVEGIAEALVIPQLGRLILKEYNDIMKSKGKKTIANTLEEMGVSVININGIYFNYFMKIFGNFNGSSGPCIPIYCSGLTDRDPEADSYPLKDEFLESKNPVMGYIDGINSNEFTRLYMSPLKTFEYDLAMVNTKIFATVLKSLWPTQEGSVTTKLNAIATNQNTPDPSKLMEDAKYIYTHIDSSQIGKGIFAYALAESIKQDFIIPEYIKKAVLWSCGGIKAYE